MTNHINVNVSVPEVLFLQTIQSGQVTEGEVLSNVASVWSNSPGNVTIQVISDDFTTDPNPIITAALGLITPTAIVSITSKEDFIAQGDRTVTVTIQASSSTGITGAPQSFQVTIQDDDTAGIIITESDGNTAVTEGGATDTYTVVLTSQPTANVTVNLNGEAQLNPSPTALTFTPQNWNVAQIVTVSAVDDALIEGDHTQTITHTATSSDSKYNEISISSVTANITDNDRNDAPSFTAGVNQTVAEDSGAQTVVNWATNISPGPPDEVNQTVNFQVSNDNNGLFSIQPAIDAAGNLTYTPVANANGSALVTVILQDNGGIINGGVDTSAAQTFTITINPVNDTATISGTATGAITEDLNVVNGNLSITGNLSVTDVDTDEDKFKTTVTSANGNLGSLTITDAGAFTYTVANSAVQFLGAGVTKTETFTVTSFDATASQDITVTITGVNNTASITGTVTASVTEDASTSNLTATGNLTVNDVDTGEAKFNTTVTSANGNLGSLAITDAGTFTYTVANSTVQFLGAGVTKTETFTVTSLDATASQDITVTITGVNDTASITGTATASVTEDASTPNLTATGNLTVNDVDTGEAKFNTTVTSTNGNLGSLTITDAGAFTYTVANSAVQFLGAGQTKTETFTVKSVDDTASQDITITINGSNNAPTNLLLSKSDIDEESPALSIIGLFSSTDTDIDDRFTYSLVDGDNADDNNAFIIDGNQLKIKAAPYFEIKPNYKIRVRTNDGGLSYEKALTISVNDLDIPNRLTTQDDDIFRITSDNPKVALQVTLIGSNSNQVNQLGVFIVDDATGKINGIAPGEAGYAQAALERAQVIFSAITNIPNGFNPSNLTRLLELDSGANLRFYLIKNNSTTDGILAGINPITEVLFANTTTQKVTNLSNDQFSLSWEDGSGTSTNDFQDLVVKIQASNQSVALGANLQGRSQAELIDLRGVNTSVTANFSVYREAAFNNFVGFYQITDENGGIDINGDGNADILPGQASYTQAAVGGRVAGIDLAVNNQGTATFTGSFQAGAIFAPFLIVNSRPDAVLDNNPNNDPAVYFPFLGANADKIDHIRLLGDNAFGFEDLHNGGDKDFNDLIVQFTLNVN